MVTNSQEERSVGVTILREAADQALTSIGDRKLYSSCSRVQSAGSDILGATVGISPAASVKRHYIRSHGLVTDIIYLPLRMKIEIRFDGAVHLLIMYEGARHKGETSIEGLAPSKLRNFNNKLTFVPAGHAYQEWHEISTPARVTYLYFDPAKLRKSNDVEAQYAPKAFFEDAGVWETAVKLKSVVQRGQPEDAPYSEALVRVLAHELSCSDEDIVRTSATRGGLASWQMRAVAAYVEEHLNEQTSLTTLAGLARLSRYHYCRAFKRAFGVAPHQYLVQRRIEKAKILLADRATTVTEVGLILGYSQTSSFSVAFRKNLRQTPTEFRRNFLDPVL